ncbi:MAG: hypothetical protein IJ753_00050 [Bacteroidales bacterium]|nr:hypothetical protein [Bacteroidales bacterium]
MSNPLPSFSPDQVYIGSQPLDDFRYVPIKSGTPITMAGVEAAIKIL